MADNNIYRKILKTVSLDDLLKMDTVGPSAGLSRPLINPAASAEISPGAIPAESSKLIKCKESSAPEKIFPDLIGYNRFTKSDFIFHFPFLGNYKRLHYAQLIASSTAARLRYTQKIVQGIEKIAQGKVSLVGIATESDLESFLSFSDVPFKNAPADWPVYCDIYPEKYSGHHTIQPLSFSIGGESRGTIYYVLPQEKMYVFTDLRFGNITLGNADRGNFRLGGVGLVCFGSSITSAEQYQLCKFLMKSYFKRQWGLAK